jgi:DNA end-binding protein Ku
LKSIWSGTLGIGGLSFPVKLGSAVSEDKLPLHRVRRSDGSRIRQQNIAEADGQPVDWSDIVTGYETGSGQTVLLEKDDFARAYGEKNRHIAIQAFLDASKLPRTAHDTSYVVEPGKDGERAYALLALVMEETGKSAVVSVAVRQREAFALLYAVDGYLYLERLHWAADVKKPDFAAPAPKLDNKEIKLAHDLVEAFTGTFAWEVFEDTTMQKLTEVIQGKIETGQVLGTPQAPHSVTAPQDLAATLAASVEQAKAAKAPVRKPRTPRIAKPKEAVA